MKNQRRIIFTRLLIVFTVLSALTVLIKTYANEGQAAKIEKKTLKQFLRIAIQPVGETMYVWGGGWNEDDTAAGVEALTIGVSKKWKAFFEKQDRHYNTAKTRYMIHEGLDCTGFIGWALYNLFPNKEGYVMKSGVLTKTLSEYKWGEWIPSKKVNSHIAGDIMGMSGHVWISLGTCCDGSVVILHSSPPGVSLYGTQTGLKKSEAVKIAEYYISTYFPSWYKKYPNCTRGASYLTNYDMFRWNEEFLPDPDGYRNMKPDEILKDLFS